MNGKLFSTLSGFGTLLTYPRGVLFFGNKTFVPEEWPEISKNSTFLDQVHGRETIPAAPFTFKKADGQFTKTAHRPLMIRSADCIPAFLSINNFETIFGLHIGWRGLQKGILSAAVSKYINKNDSVEMWAGPHISGANFYLNSSNMNSLLSAHKISTHNALQQGLIFPSEYFPHQFHINLLKFLIVEANTLGIHKISIENTCTFQSLDHYSHRRFTGSKGRQFSFIAKT